MKIARLPPVPGTVAAYLRVSSRLQQQRETIASQREAVLEHAGSRGWIIPEEQVFADDGVSGATLDRPALEALRDAVASGRGRDRPGLVSGPSEPQFRPPDVVAGRV